ncbi:MAG: hypothetical protein VKN33_03465 [Candidatus Sericytochromatia bacterium]|nr:hypothetical protein [Candidatus Sericytochromatia bacterium]
MKRTTASSGKTRLPETPRPGASPSERSDLVSSPETGENARIIALQGRVTLTATILSNNGSGLISNNGGGILSEQGGSLIGKTKFYGLRAVRSVKQANNLVPVANALVVLADAAGDPVRDEQGELYTARTDAEGRYVFARAPRDRALVAVCQVPEGPTQVATLVPPNVATADMDVASTVMTAYVLDRYARSQSDPQAALARLPADLEAKVRQATRAALTEPPAQLDVETALRVIDKLRAETESLDALYEEVRRVMVIAGQADLGTGGQATEARFGNLTAFVTAPDGTRYLMDGGNGRLWRLVDGRLQIAAGLGGGIDDIPDPPAGAPALAVNLGRIVDFALDSNGRPLLLSEKRLDRVNNEGNLERLWVAGEEQSARSVIPVPNGGAVINLGNSLLGVAGAIAPAAPPLNRVSIEYVVRTPEGDWYYLVGSRNTTWWQSQQGGGATQLTVPDSIKLSDPFAEDYHFVRGLDGEGAFVVSDERGALIFVSPRDQSVTRISPDVTSQWPELMRPGPVRTDFSGGSVMKSYRTLGVGGSPPGGRWIRSGRAIGILDAKGQMTMLAGNGVVSPSGSSVNTPTALQTPLSALLDAQGRLLVVESSSRQVLRVQDQVASLFVGVPWDQGSIIRPGEGDPGNYVLTPGGTTLNLAFGNGYSAGPQEAYLLGPRFLRAASDGAVWLLDGTRFVRKVSAQGVETIASLPILGEIRDIWPTSTNEAMVMVWTKEEMMVVPMSRLLAGPALFTIPTPPKPPYDPDADDEEEFVNERNLADGMVQLPDGTWLLRAFQHTWRCETGKPPVDLGADGLNLSWGENESHGARMAFTESGGVVFAARRHIYRINTTSGVYTPIAGSGTGLLGGDMPDTGLIHVKGISTTPEGDLLIADVGARQVKRVPAASWRANP